MRERKGYYSCFTTLVVLLGSMPLAATHTIVFHGGEKVKGRESVSPTWKSTVKGVGLKINMARNTQTDLYTYTHAYTNTHEHIRSRIASRNHHHH